MSYFGSVKLTNKPGWSKTIALEKALCLIGSAPVNDILLPEDYGGGVLPLHLQLVCPKIGSGAYRLINLAEKEIPVFNKDLVALSSLGPRSTLIVQDGNIIQLGDFTLQFNLLDKNAVSIEKRTENIGLRLDMPDLELRSRKNLPGMLTLTNYGEQKHCQFSIDIEGLPEDCYQISPAPLLYPGAAEELNFKFIHRGTEPPAGTRPIKITAAASSSYPTEVITLLLDLQVAPIYQYSLVIVDKDQQAERSKSEGIMSDQNESQAASVPEILAAAPVGAIGEQVQNEQITSPQTKLNPKKADTTSLNEAGEPAPETLINKTINGAQLADAIPLKPVETTAMVPFSISDDEQNWWTDDVPSGPSTHATDRLNSAKKDIKSRLAGKDIQIIKAGVEIEEEEDNDDHLG